jgi:putative methionine-R-sulfoxide reductase with GAF domain
LYLVDPVQGVLRSKTADYTGTRPFEIRMPIGTGIAGRVAATGKSLNIDDPYNHPDFNPDIDRISAERVKQGVSQQTFITRSILCEPILNRQGAVIGVAQLLNKRDATGFTADDERRLHEFAGPLGIILETCGRLMVSGDAVAGARVQPFTGRPQPPIHNGSG